MNIFILDKNPKICAEYHNDKHCIKMILESAQLLCSVHWLNGSNAPYKLTHKNHPCSIWVRKSYSNYRWLCDLSKNLCHEYTFRFGKRHKTEDVIDYCINNQPNITDIGITSFVKVLPEEYNINDDVIECYRAYYKYGKSNLIKYTKRDIPKFLI